MEVLGLAAAETGVASKQQMAGKGACLYAPTARNDLTFVRVTISLCFG